MSAVTIADEPLVIEDVLRVVEGEEVAIGSAARARIESSRAVVDRAIASGAAIYGLTTRVGHAESVRLSEEEIRTQQQMLVMTHAGGIRGPLPTPRIRAAMAVRLIGIARGGSGASVEAAEVLAAMLNARVHPIVPETSSVGAGDLGQMAYVAQVAIGMGRAEHQGDVLPGDEALRRAGITPLALGPKDGLALISANAVSIGHAALVVARAARVTRIADLSAATSMEATDANPSIILPAVAAAKAIPGQIEATAHLREALDGSDLLDGRSLPHVQDPLSFRVAPQVHGALREYLGVARAAVEVELNAASDNPLVSVEDQALISNGNFHPMVMAIAFDALRVAIAHVGQLSERRMGHLWDAFFALLPPGGPPVGEGGALPQLFGLSLRYSGAVTFSELRQLAAPATLDTPPLEIGVEDHATGAPLSVRKTDAALDLLEDILAIELLLARDVVNVAPARRITGRGTRAAFHLADEAVRQYPQTPSAGHQALREALKAATRSA